MTDSLAERALCAIESRLRAIRTDDGYSTDAGLNVFRARRHIGPAELPCVVLWDLGEQPEGDAGASGGGTFMNKLTVSVEVLAQANQGETGRTLEKLKADVKRAVMNPASGKVADEHGSCGTLSYTGGVAFAREDGSNSESVTVNFLVHYKEVFGDPTQGEIARPTL